MIVKMINDGYIVSVGEITSTIINENVVEINEVEENTLVNLFNNKPIAPEGYNYKLNANELKWELVEIPPEPEEVTDTEALRILLGDEE